MSPHYSEVGTFAPAPRQAAVPLFEQLLAEHGDSPRALDWSVEGQATRFKVLDEVGITNKHSVLDVGCGLGHFYDYLREVVDPDIQYTGVDASAKMVEAAIRRCSLRKVKGIRPLRVAFEQWDAISGPPLPRASVVVASGVLNIEEWCNQANMRALLRRCFEASTFAAAVNMLSTFAPKKREGRHYYDPEWALAEALALTPRASLRHDYRDNDFTVYLYRRAV